MGEQNYTLGRGRVFFSRFKPGTRTPIGFDYIGNTPEFSLTIDSENLDHFSADEGIKEKDDSVPLSVTRTGSFTTDNISPDNVSLFFFGEKITLTQGAIAAHDEIFEDVVPGRFYQLGATETNPVGARGITAGATVKSGATTYVIDRDYRLDRATGQLEIVEGGTIALNTDITVNWAAAVSTRARVISGSAPVEGAMRYIANNPKGDDFDYIFPYVKITPNGDYALKGDEWQTIPFNLEALKPNLTTEAIYMDGRPAFA